MATRKYNSSNEIPSIDIYNNKTLQELELKTCESFTTKYLKQYAGFTTKQIKVIFNQMKAKEWDKETVESFCKTNFPGKKGLEYREKLIPVMSELNEIYRKQIKHVLLGA